MIWHLYDYYLDADAGYFAAKKACEPLHIQYSYDDRSIVVVNSTYQPVEGLQASVHVHGLKWNELFSTSLSVDAAADSSQRVISIPENLYIGPERIFFIDLASLRCGRPCGEPKLLLGARHADNLRLEQNGLHAHAGIAA